MPSPRPNRLPPALAAGLLTAALGWAFWPAVASIGRSWYVDPENGHGPLVLAVSLYLGWRARGRLADADLRPSAWGLVALVVAGAARAGTGLIHSAALDQILLLPTALAGVWAVFGGAAARAVGPAVGYLFFAIPLHGRLGFLFTDELQSVSTVLSTAALQLVGVPAQREGNVIVLSDTDLGVVETCSGLRMTMSFFAVSVAFAVLLRRPLWQRLAVVAAAVPVAVACNVVRIVATAVVHETAGKRWADLVFHDLAGWLMMPLALGFLWVELFVTDRLLTARPAAAAGPVAVGS